MSIAKRNESKFQSGGGNSGSDILKIKAKNLAIAITGMRPAGSENSERETWSGEERRELRALAAIG